ncbi:MAG: CDGSH iron-sulfur domain-containing protein [Gammaproteobacteria bacterium]|nr:CDGSH iron-sulfur domain-containing protein [Gammaproteobacteria bacterium]MCY4217824.1 CDGSH iron-sulfur domain-containing protein [Gammaproteobacteria bacterium]MCY4275655.1 CDGSH iron-sulfur domain-containing protein [Gammaproteobacteria bacterium]
MNNPVRAADSPFKVSVTEGKNYFWCSCGKSQNQPFCDGSHKGSEFTPVRFSAEKTGDVWLCGCKSTSNQPFCDGSHNQ